MNSGNWIPRRKGWLCILLTLLLCLPPLSWSADKTGKKRYGITLASALRPIQSADLPAVEVLENYHVYTSSFTKDGKVWYRLRVGFFDSVNQARPVLRQLRKRYHDAWINRVSDSEYRHALASRIGSAALQGSGAVGNSSLDVTEQLARARQLLTQGDAAAAISVLRSIIAAIDAQRGEGRQRYADVARASRELLGVAQERTGARRAAIATYQDYLRRYPEGEDSERVRQRLVVLQTAAAPAPKPMEKFREKPESMAWSGSFSQFSNRDIRFLDGGGYDISSMLFNDLGITGRYRSDRFDIRTQLDTSYRYIFNTDSTTEDHLRLSSMFVDLNEKRFHTGAKLGRQSASSGGVLGRFDGAWLSYRAGPRWKYNLVTGFPVELSSTSTVDEADRSFVGMSIDMGTFARVWDMNAFAIGQQINGIVDRQAVGGELRYSDRRQSHLMLVDYDISYDTLNSFLTVSNWFLPSQTSFNLVLDTRMVPVLTTTNALIGRSETGIDQMLLVLSEDEIRQLAQDRTSRSYSATIGMSYPFSERFQINGDVSAFRQSDTPASGGVAAVDNGGNQFSYSVTMIGSNVFKQGDISILGLRYADSVSTAVSSLNLNVRYPLTNAWRAGPAVVVNYRDNSGASDQVTVRPSLRIDYRWLSNITLDAELALLHIEDLGDTAASDTNMFFELGYRVDFQ